MAFIGTRLLPCGKIDACRRRAHFAPTTGWPARLECITLGRTTETPLPGNPSVQPPLHNGSVMLVVDVESDWGTPRTEGIRRVLPRLLELLERHRATATFFVVGELAGEVARVLPARRQHEVGSHGLTHALLTRLSREEIIRELETSKATLEAHGYEVLGFRAPFLKCPAELPA